MIKRTDSSARFISSLTSFFLGPHVTGANSNSIIFWSCSPRPSVAFDRRREQQAGITASGQQAEIPVSQQCIIALFAAPLLNPLDSCNENLPKKGTLRKYALSKLQCRRSSFEG